MTAASAQPRVVTWVYTFEIYFVRQPYNYIIVLKFENDMNISYNFCIFIFKIVHS